MRNWQSINKPKRELANPHQLPPEELELDYPERIIFSPFECLLHFADFPELHNLAEAAQLEGRSGLTYPEVEEAKAGITAQGEDKKTRAQIIDQHLAARIDQPYGYPAQTPQQSTQSSSNLPNHPQSPRQEPDTEVPNGKTLSSSSLNEYLFQFWDFPKLFQPAQAAQCEGQSDTPSFNAKAKIAARQSSFQAENPQRSQDRSEGASLSATTGNTNLKLVPRSDAQTSYPVPSFIYTAGRAQRESTPTRQSGTSRCIEKAKSQTVGPRTNSQIGAEDLFHSLTPNQSEFSKSIKPDRNLYPPLHRLSDRKAFDKDLIWQLEHPRLFGYSKPYREHPPLGPTKGSSLLQDPRFKYLQSSYHETERLLRSLEGKITWPGPSLVDPFHATLPRRRIDVEDLRNQQLTNEIFAWHWQSPQYK